MLFGEGRGGLHQDEEVGTEKDSGKEQSIVILMHDAITITLYITMKAITFICKQK